MSQDAPGVEASLQSRREAIDLTFKLLNYYFSHFWSPHGLHRFSYDANASKFINSLWVIEQHVLNVEYQKVLSPSSYNNFLKARNFQEAEKVMSHYRQLSYEGSWFEGIAGSRRFKMLDHHYYGASRRGAKANIHMERSAEYIKDLVQHTIKNNPEAYEQANENILKSLALEGFAKYQDKVDQDKAALFSELSSFMQRCCAGNRPCYVLCVEVGYISQRHGIAGFERCPLPGELVRQHHTTFQKALSINSLVIGCIQKPLFNRLKGHSFLYVLLLDQRKQFSEAQWVQSFRKLWEEATERIGVLHNYNPELRHWYPSVMGVLTKSKKRKLQAFMEKVIFPIASIEAYVTINPEFDFVQARLIGKSPLMDVLNNDIQFMRFKALATVCPKDDSVFEKAQPGKPDITVQRQVKEVRSVFEQAQHAGSLDLLIELLMVSALHLKQPAFYENPRAAITGYTRHISQFGRQLLFLNSQGDFFNMNGYLVHMRMSTNILLFRFALWQTLQQSGLKQTVQSLTDSHQVSFYNLLTSHLHMLLDDTNPLERYKSTLALCPYGGLLINRLSKLIQQDAIKPKSIRRWIAVRAQTTQNTFEDASSMLQTVFRQDVLLWCFKLAIDFDFPLPGQKNALSSFMVAEFFRYTQNVIPLSARLGYVGRWEQDMHGHFFARIIFMMPLGQLVADDLMRATDEMRLYWERFLLDHPNILKSKKITTSMPGISHDPARFHLQAESAPISTLQDFNVHYYIIQKKDKSRQKQFIGHILLHLIKQEQYFPYDYPDMQDTFAKAVIKSGNKPLSSPQPTGKDSAFQRKRAKAIHHLQPVNNDQDYSDTVQLLPAHENTSSTDNTMQTAQPVDSQQVKVAPEEQTESSSSDKKTTPHPNPTYKRMSVIPYKKRPPARTSGK